MATLLPVLCHLSLHPRAIPAELPFGQCEPGRGEFASMCAAYVGTALGLAHSGRAAHQITHATGNGSAGAGHKDAQVGRQRGTRNVTGLRRRIIPARRPAIDCRRAAEGGLRGAASMPSRRELDATGRCTAGASASANTAGSSASASGGKHDATKPVPRRRAGDAYRCQARTDAEPSIGQKPRYAPKNGMHSFTGHTAIQAGPCRAYQFTAPFISSRVPRLEKAVNCHRRAVAVRLVQYRETGRKRGRVASDTQ